MRSGARPLTVSQKSQVFGVILCRNCNRIIDTLDTERFTVYYMSCKDENCRLPDDDEAQAVMD